MSTTDPAGRYPTGTVGLARNWDGHAWSLAPTSDPAAPTYHSPRHSIVRTRRFWFAVIAVLLGAALSGIAGLVQPEAARISVLVIAGLLATGAALLALTSAVWQRLRIVDALTTNGRRIPAFVGLGAVAGVVGFALALGVELLVTRVLHAGTVGSLFLAGPIEETAKLVVPVIAFFVLGRTFRDPRVGFALVWVGASLFGLLEGIEYVAGVGIEASRHNERVVWISGEVFDTVERSLVEIMHPLMTAAAASVMWLGAWRGKGLFSAAGVLAYLTAVVLHSVNDGVFGGLLHGVSPLLALLGTPIMLVAIYTVFRRHVRELVPPSRIAAEPARWRPRLPTDRAVTG